MTKCESIKSELFVPAVTCKNSSEFECTAGHEPTQWGTVVNSDVILGTSGLSH